MFKIANQVICPYDDTGFLHLRKIAQINPQIYMMTPSELQNLCDDDFALSVITKKAQKLNKFPINSHDNVWLSNQYFDETHYRLPKEAQAVAAHHIKVACDRFNLKPTDAVIRFSKTGSVNSNLYYERDITKTAAVQRTSSIDLSKFAEVENICDNYTCAQYAFPTPTHVKLACQYFDKYHQQIPLDYRHKYAAAIQKRASELGLGQQGGTVAKYASDYYSGQVDAHLRARASLLEAADPKFVTALQKLGSMKKQLEPMDFAKVLHGFDKRAGLSKYYGGALQDPYVATFAQEPTPYQSYIAKLASGDTLNADEIRKVSSEKYDKIKEYFGKSVADELKKEGVPIFDSLPTDAKEIIAGIANGNL